ncbi:MAG: efflux RND transporter periplasmic adaptor subunit, partial [Moraxellaceae bacterium]
DGERVRQGALLAQIDDRAIRARLAQANAARAQAAAQLQQAEQDLARYRALQTTSTIAEQAVAQQATRVAELKAALAAAEASVAAADTDLSHARITAPITGRAGLRRVDAGNQVRASDAGGIVTLTQVDPLAVVFSLPQEVLPRLHPLKAASTPATVEVFARDGGEALATGRLETFDNSVDAASGTIRLKALFPGSAALWPGQFVSARLHAGVLEQALVVPASAVQRSRDGSFVWKVTGDKAQPVPVTVVHEGGGRAVIGEGLAEGDRVVTDGQLRLKPGARVKTGEEQADAAR